MFLSKTNSGLLLLALGLAVLVVGLLNLFVASYHIHFSTDLADKNELTTTFFNLNFLTATHSLAVERKNERDRPPLDSLIQGWNVTGDISFLLDFAIVGFPKCGTSSLMYQLKNHSQVDIFTDERCDMSYNKQVLLAKDLYNQMAPNHYRGLKCPMDMESMPLALPNYNKFFPQTKFIVGIRHPVLWFESFYNFRVHNGYTLPPPSQLIGRCRKRMKNVCTFRGNFHLFLANLGKTNIRQNPKELRLFVPGDEQSIKPLNDSLVHRQVFLYEVTQLSDMENPQYTTQFLQDLQHFLGLEQAFPDPMLWFRPGKTHETQEEKEKISSRKINICDSQHAQVRHILVEQATNASAWIANFFVNAPGVTVSSPEHFVHTILARWKKDPCLERSVFV